MIGDKQIVFYKGDEVVGADAATFEAIGYYSTDEKNFKIPSTDYANMNLVVLTLFMEGWIVKADDCASELLYRNFSRLKVGRHFVIWLHIKLSLNPDNQFYELKKVTGGFRICSGYVFR